MLFAAFVIGTLSVRKNIWEILTSFLENCQYFTSKPEDTKFESYHRKRALSKYPDREGPYQSTYL